MKEASQVDRLCAMFADKVTSGTDPNKVTLKNGSLNLSRALGISPGSVSHWRNRGEGRVPLEWYGRIFEAAELAQVPRSELAAVLLGTVCPCCGQPVEPGSVAA